VSDVWVAVWAPRSHGSPTVVGAFQADGEAKAALEEFAARSRVAGKPDWQRSGDDGWYSYGGHYFTVVRCTVGQVCQEAQS